MTMIWYEFKNRISFIWITVLGAISFLAVYFVMQKIPQLVTNTAQIINRSPIALEVAGLDEPISSITYLNIMITFMIFFSVFTMYNTMKDMANSIIRERQLGTALFFFSHNITKSRLLTAKLIMSILILIIEYAVWGVIFWRISLHGLGHVPVYNEVITEHVVNMLLMILVINILCLAIGFFYGCTTKHFSSDNFSFQTVSMGCFFTILPNFIRACICVLDDKNIATDAWKTVYNITSKIRDFIPIYWCNPINVFENQISKPAIIIASLLISVMLIVSGIIVYSNREDFY